MFLARFIAAFAIAAVSTVGGSVLWPMLTSSPRPNALEQVHTAFVTTPLGQQVEDVLGVSDGPVDAKLVIASASAKVVETVGKEVQKKAEDLIYSRISEEIIRRYETLPTDDKDQVKKAVCEPAQ